MSNKKKKIIEINRLKKELESFDKDVQDSSELLEGEKRKLIKEVKSGLFEEMLDEIENRKEPEEKKENFFDKLSKLF